MDIIAPLFVVCRGQHQKARAETAMAMEISK